MASIDRLVGLIDRNEMDPLNFVQAENPSDVTRLGCLLINLFPKGYKDMVKTSNPSMIAISDTD